MQLTQGKWHWWEAKTGEENQRVKLDQIICSEQLHDQQVAHYKETKKGIGWPKVKGKIWIMES